MRAFAAFWILSAAVSAQNAPESIIRTKVELVMVPVVVRDHEGKTVGGLTQKDFQLFDTGKPQTIGSFSVEGSVAAISKARAPGDPKSAAPAADGTIVPTRFIAYLFDDLHLPAGEFITAREAARKHVREKLQPGDRAAVFTTSGKVTLDFTHDLALIDQALLHILPQASANSSRDCPPMTYYMADAILNQNNSDAMEMATSDYLKCNLAATRTSASTAVRGSANRVLSQGGLDTQITLSTLNNVIRRISIAPGQRMVVLVSSGFFINADFRQRESEVMDRAIRSQVTIGAVDARGLYVVGNDPSGAIRPDVRTLGARSAMENQRAAAEGEALGEMAQATGGVWFHNNNDLADGLNRVSGAPEYYYVLGFSPRDLKLDGSFHALKVTVKAKNVSSQARHGYVAGKRAFDKEEQAKADLHDAFVSRGEIVEIPVTVRTEFVKSKPGAVQLTVAANIDLKGLPFRKSEGRNLDTLTVAAGLFDTDGKLVVEGVSKSVNLAFRDETIKAGKADAMETKLTFEAPTGKYVLRLVVRDSEGERIGARNAVVEIP